MWPLYRSLLSHPGAELCKVDKVKSVSDATFQSLHVVLPLVKRISGKRTQDREASSWLWENRWLCLLKSGWKPQWESYSAKMLFSYSFDYYYWLLFFVIKTWDTKKNTHSRYSLFHTAYSYRNDRCHQSEGGVATSPKRTADMSRHWPKDDPVTLRRFPKGLRASAQRSGFRSGPRLPVPQFSHL